MTEIHKTKEQQKTQAIRIKNLFNKYQNWRKAYYNVIEFTEPVMFFTRRSGEVEFYEKVTAGLFEYKHSNGENRFLIVNPTTQQKFGFANKKFRGYLAHEDHPMTGFPDALITAEQTNILVEKALTDLKKYKAQELKEWKGMIKWGLIGLAIVIGAWFLGKSFIGGNPQAAQTVVQVIQQNATILP